MIVCPIKVWKTLPLMIFLIALVALALLGCSDSSTDPNVSPDDLRFSYIPSGPLVDLLPGEGMEFSLDSDPSVSLNYEWTMNQEPVEGGQSFFYSADRVGVDTLQVHYRYSGVGWDRIWYANVESNPSTQPNQVPGVTVTHADEAGAVQVNWLRISDSVYTIESYQVAVSYEGVLTANTWDDAEILGTYTRMPGQVGYSVVFDHENNGLPPGVEAWFGVRGIDEVGQLSVLNHSPRIVISTAWYIEGFVYSDRGEALPNVIIDYGCTDCRVNTDVNGFYSIGPLPNVNVYDLTTLSANEAPPGEPLGSWYDFTAQDVSYVADQTYDLTVMTRYGLDESCQVFDLDFFNYFVYVTNTQFPTTFRPNRVLYRWENYPVSVYVPPYENEHGLDYQQLCQEVVGYWNIAMDEEYFVLVDSVEEADVEMYFGNEGEYYAGRAYLIEPSDEDFRIGDVVPEKMKVYVWDQLSEGIYVQETAMHELGHTLGLLPHSICSGDNFLMANNNSGILANGPENAVHPDEKHAVRVIRAMPQGTDMADFDVE